MFKEDWKLKVPKQYNAAIQFYKVAPAWWEEYPYIVAALQSQQTARHNPSVSSFERTFREIMNGTCHTEITEDPDYGLALGERFIEWRDGIESALDNRPLFLDILKKYREKLVS